MAEGVVMSTQHEMKIEELEAALAEKDNKIAVLKAVADRRRDLLYKISTVIFETKMEDLYDTSSVSVPMHILDPPEPIELVRAEEPGHASVTRRPGVPTRQEAYEILKARSLQIQSGELQ